MYIPAANAETDTDTLFAYIAASSLGALVTVDAKAELVATHLPWIVQRDRGEQGVLEGHIARANREHGDAQHALVIFTGPDAYVSPTWYRSKAEHGKVVPTWNYVAVHVYGRLRFTTERAFLEQHLERLVARHEGSRPDAWSMRDAPADYIARQLNAIVGVELAIERVEGKWKMSQNRPAADIDGVVQGLRNSSDAKAQAVADIVEERKPYHS